MNFEFGLTSTFKLHKPNAVFVITPGDSEREFLAKNAIKAAKDAGVDFVLLLSVISVDTDTIFGRQIGPIEKYLHECDMLPHCILRLPIFLDNVFGQRESLQTEGKFYGPVQPGALHVPVAVMDVGDAAAKVLLDYKKHTDKVYSLTGGPSVSHKEIADAWSTVLHKDVQYVQISYEDNKKALMDLGMPEWQAEGTNELYQLMDKGTPVMSETTDHVLRTSGRQPTTPKDWMSYNREAFV